MLVAPRYLSRELIVVVTVVFVLVLFVALGGRMIGYLQEAAMGRYSAGSLFTLIGLRVPEFAQLTLPFALFVALLLTIGRLYAEQEAAVFAAAGVGPSRLLRWCLPAVVLLASAVACLSFWVTPYAASQFAEAVAEQRVDRQLEALSPGTFHALSGGRRVTYAEAIDPEAGELTGVFIADLSRDNQSMTVWAERGRQHLDPDTGSSFLLLTDGLRYEGRPGSQDYRVVAFASLAQRIATEPQRFRRVKPETLPTAELMASDVAESRAELHWRGALVLFTLIGAVMAVAVARVRPRQGRFARVAPGVMLLVLYYLALVLNLDLLREGELPSVVGLWPVHGAFALLAAWLLRRASAPAAV